MLRLVSLGVPRATPAGSARCRPAGPWRWWYGTPGPRAVPAASAPLHLEVVDDVLDAARLPGQLFRPRLLLGRIHRSVKVNSAVGGVNVDPGQVGGLVRDQLGLDRRRDLRVV